MTKTPAVQLIVDSVSVGLAILLVEVAFAFISFDQGVNFRRLLSGAIVRFVFYFLFLAFFTKLGRNSRFLPLLFAIVLASVVAGGYELMLLIDADPYLTQHPEAFWPRISTPALFVFGLLVPIYSVISIIVILLGRLVTNSK